MQAQGFTKSVRRLLKDRNYLFLWIGQLLSMVGDWALIVALPLHVYDRTRSASATSFTFIAYLLPRVLLVQLAGTLVDRWNRPKVVMISADLLRAGLLSLLLYSPFRQTPIIYLVAFSESLVSGFFDPARASMVLRLVPTEQLGTANSLGQISDNTSRLLGPMIGGLVYGFGRLGGVVWVDVSSYVTSAIVVLLVASRILERPSEERQGLLASWRDGITIFQRRPLLFWLVTISVVVSVGEGLLSVVLIPFVRGTLKGSSVAMGTLLASRGISGLLAGFLAGILINKLGGQRLLIMGLVGAGILIITLSSARSVTQATGLVFLAGIPAVAIFVSMQTLMQQDLKQAMSFVGRVTSVLLASSSVASIAGMASAGIVVRMVGERVALVAAGGTYLVGVLGALRLLRSAPIQNGVGGRLAELETFSPPPTHSVRSTPPDNPGGVASHARPMLEAGPEGESHDFEIQ